MPTKNFKNLGEVQGWKYYQGTIVEVKGADATEELRDTATVNVSGLGTYSGVPIFYHCQDSAVERSNGALTGAAKAFGVGDEVLVLKEIDGDGIFVSGRVEGPKPCIWEPWGGELTKNHNWIIVNNALPCSVSTDPIYNTYYYVSIPSTGSTSRWQSHLVKWGDISDPGYGSHPSTPSDIPFDGITFSNCKVILDIEGLSFYISHPGAIQSGIGLYFYGADIAYGFFFHISYETPIITGVREFDLSVIFAGVDTLMTGMSIEYVVETWFFEPPVTYTFAMGLALNYIDIVRV